MDPLTIATTVGGLSALIYQTSKTLYDFIEGTRLVDEKIDAIYAEIQSLARMVSSVESTIRAPALRSSGPDDLWLRVEACLTQCQSMMQGFSQIVEKLESKRKSTPLRDAIRYFRLTLNEDELVSIRARIQTHTQSLSLIVQTLNL